MASDPPVDPGLLDSLERRATPGWVARLEGLADEHAQVVARLPLARERGGVRPAPARGQAAPEGGPGQPLPSGLRAGLEGHFDRDLSRVRVHADAATGKRVEALGAAAYATGEHVYFATGRYDPFTPDGRQLIGHELTHVEQFYAGLLSGNERLLQERAGPRPAGPPCRLRIEARPAASPAFQGMKVEYYWTHDPIITAAGSRYPRIHRKWEAQKPDGEVHRDWFTNPTLELELDQVGQWRISVWVEWARGEVHRLDHWQTVTTAAAHASQQLPQLETYEYVKFRVGVGLQHVSLAHNCPHDQRAPGFWIECHGPNPSGWSHQAVNSYTVHAPDSVKAFRWYARLSSWEGIATQNYYGYRPTTVHGERAFLLRSQGRSADYPMFASGVNTIVCECLDRDGKLLGTATYRQAVLRSEEHERYQAFAAYMRQADEALATIAPGREVGTRTIYVNKETGKSLQLALFVGRDAKDPGRIKLVDLTPGVSRTEYAGATLHDALGDFERGNAYPEGLVRIEVPRNDQGIPALTRDVRTTGESLWQAFSSRLGWASLALVAGGVVASFIPGGQVVALTCFVAAAGTGAASGGLSLYDRLQQAEISARGVAIDVFGIASSILGGAGAVMFRGLKAGSAVAVAGRSTRYVLLSGLSADLGAGVLMAWDGVAQIQQVLDAQGMSRGEKINSIVLVLSNLALNGGLLVLSVRDARQTLGPPSRTAPVAQLGQVETRPRAGAASGQSGGGPGSTGSRAQELAESVGKKTGVGTAAVTRTVTASPAPVGAEVYLGFMDEEVNDILRHLRLKYPDRPVLVVERAKGVSGGRLFERPWEFYGSKPSRSASTGTLREGVDKNLPQRLARRMKAGIDPRELEAARVGGQKLKTAGEAPGSIDPNLYVGEFAPTGGQAAGPPVILVRAPELGLQPGLVGAYLKPILGGIQGELGAVRLHVFGAGGAVGEGLKPGSRSRMVGSVFVGVRRLPGEELAYQGVVALRTKDGELQHFFVGEKLSVQSGLSGEALDKADKQAKTAAERQAREAFQARSTTLTQVSPTGQPVGGRTLQQAVQEVTTRARAQGEDDTVSLTSSFFSGGRDKDAGRALGLSDVNMEDFHVLDVAAELKLDPRLITIERINADPSVIDPQVVQRVQQWAREARLSDQDYAAAIEWGMSGALLERMPASGHWTVFEGELPGMKTSDLVVAHGPSGRVVNPYYTELAVDLIEEAADKGKALEPFRFSATQAFGQLGDEGLVAQVDLLVRIKMAEVGQLAQAVKDAGAGAARREAIQRFVASLRQMEIDPRSQVGAVLDVLSPEELARVGVQGKPGAWSLPVLADAQGQMRFWARPGKFNDLYTAPTLDVVLGSGYQGGAERSLVDAVDRALYKSSNRPALEERAGSFIEGQLRLSADQGGSGLPGGPTATGQQAQTTSGQIRRRAAAGVLRMAGVPGASGWSLGGPIRVTRPGGGGVRIQSLTLKWAGSTAGAPLRRKALDPAAGEVPPGLEELIAASAGFELPLGLRERLERLLGVPLGGVRVHTDAAARAATQSVGAEAFALGEDLFFARGRYDPGSQRGLMLLGHELTHVAQEKGGAPTLDAPQEGALEAPREVSGGLRVGAALDRLESQAERNERALARLWRPGFGAATPERARGEVGSPGAPGAAGAGVAGEATPDRPAQGPRRAVALGAPSARASEGELAERLERPGPGLPLELGLRSRLERALGQDLGAVRLHTGLGAERISQALEAEAVTRGEHVFLGAGQGPESPGGLRVLAHEATHVLQAQRGRLAGPATPAATRALEAEAYASERALARPAPRAPREAPPLVVRAAPEPQARPAPAMESRPAGGLRRVPEPAAELSSTADPVLRVMQAWSVPSSREEFLTTVRDRLMELLAEELELEAERRETLGWNPFRPMA